MAVPSFPITCRDSALIFYDGSGTPLTLTLDFEEGNVNFQNLSHLMREVLELYDRDDLAALRYGRRKPVPFSFTAYLKALSDSTVKLISDLLLKKGAWSSATSTQGVNAEVMTYKLEWVIERSNFGGSGDNTLTANHCFFTGTISEEPGGFTKLEMNGTAYIFADEDFTWT